MIGNRFFRPNECRQNHLFSGPEIRATSRRNPTISSRQMNLDMNEKRDPIMKTKLTTYALGMLLGINSTQGQSRFDELANIPFSENRPTPQTARTLRDELLFQRATQTYLWALPLINTLGMKEGSEKTFGAGYNVLPIWKKRLDAKTLVTTPNSDVIYAMSYVDLGKDGPLVFEAPPNLQGILLDFWQCPIPVDGGKFLDRKSFV